MLILLVVIAKVIKTTTRNIEKRNLGINNRSFFYFGENHRRYTLHFVAIYWTLILHAFVNTVRDLQCETNVLLNVDITV